MAKQQEMDIVLGHADEADGIEEYDNKLPTWWVGLFVICCIWAAIYALDWHVLNSRSLYDRYEDEVAWAAETFPAAEPIEVVINDDTIAAGAEVYATNCVACHGEDATGTIGPDLTDSEWIHGGTPDEISQTVFYGVTGDIGTMIGWGPILGPEAVANAVAYVHSLGGGEAPTEGQGDEEATNP